MPKPQPIERKPLDSDAANRGTMTLGRHRVEARGLDLNVTADGSKSWVLRVVASGKRGELGLGSYPDVGLAQAKSQPARYRQVARRGGDPAAARDKVRVEQRLSNRLPTRRAATLRICGATPTPQEPGIAPSTRTLGRTAIEDQ